DVSLCTTCVTDFGAQADGETDDTGAFQAALDAAAEKGGIVYAPAGTYRIDGTLDVPQGVMLRGVWEAPHHADIGKGTVLYATSHKGVENGPPFIMLNQSSGVRGLTIFYPDQVVTDIQPYPWCIQGKGMHCSVRDVTLVNPYKGIDFGTHPNELHLIENVFGQPLRLGVFVDQTTDIGRIQNVHFNPHAWVRADHPSAAFDPKVLFAYLEEHFVGFLIGKTDWEYMRDCFCIFPKIGFHFVNAGHGPGNVVLTQCGADICPIAVQVDACQAHSGIAFTNAQIMGTVIVGADNRGPVKFVNSGFWTIPKTNEQVINNGRGTVTLSACHFHDWGVADRDAPCIRINNGAAIIQGCDFMNRRKKQLLIDGDAEAVSVTGCRLRRGAKIDNRSDNAQVELAGNLTR
ncbi:MAG: glycosyl hydrolase family 28-related protein, partial [Candidatus Hydrogenedentota bacterium]